MEPFLPPLTPSDLYLLTRQGYQVSSGTFIEFSSSRSRWTTFLSCSPCNSSQSNLLFLCPFSQREIKKGNSNSSRNSRCEIKEYVWQNRLLRSMSDGRRIFPEAGKDRGMQQTLGSNGAPFSPLLKNRSFSIYRFNTRLAFFIVSFSSCFRVRNSFLPPSVSTFQSTVSAFFSLPFIRKVRELRLHNT